MSSSLVRWLKDVEMDSVAPHKTLAKGRYPTFDAFYLYGTRVMNYALRRSNFLIPLPRIASVFDPASDGAKTDPLTPLAMVRVSSSTRRKRHLAHAFHELLRDATGDFQARIKFTHDWHYTNSYNATIQGLPQCLSLCRPYDVSGGPTMENRLLRLIKSGHIHIIILSPSAFALRRTRALTDGRFTPLTRKRRTDVGHPHARRKRYLWEREHPNTTEIVTEEMEDGVFVYPDVQREHRVSNVERKRREEREKERTKRRQRCGVMGEEVF